MTRKPDEWMPLHVRKYLGDTMHLSRDQHGAYLLLLMAYWMRGGPLPGNDSELATIVRASTSEWRRLKVVLAPYFNTENGHWSQKRADQELARAVSLTESRTTAGHLGGKASAAKRQANIVANDQANVEQEAKQNPTPKQLPKPEERKETKTISLTSVRSSKPPSGDFDAFWIHCPRKVGKGAAEKAHARALQKTAPETLLAGIQRYASCRAGQPEQYTVHPATWLNEERWLDETGPPAGGATIHVLSPEVRAQEQENLRKLGLA